MEKKLTKATQTLVDMYFEMRKARRHEKMMDKVLRNSDMPINPKKKSTMRLKYAHYKAKYDKAFQNVVSLETRWDSKMKKLSFKQKVDLEQAILADSRRKS